MAAVFSNKAEAYGLTRARKAGVEAVYFPRQENESRQGTTPRLAAQVAAFEPDYVILAGWMRLLSAAFLSVFPNRVINLHPALPGAFPEHARHRTRVCRPAGRANRPLRRDGSPRP